MSTDSNRELCRGPMRVPLFFKKHGSNEREINKRGKKYKQILNKNEFRTKAEKEVEKKWKKEQNE